MGISILLFFILIILVMAFVIALIVLLPDAIRKSEEERKALLKKRKEQDTIQKIRNTDSKLNKDFVYNILRKIKDEHKRYPLNNESFISITREYVKMSSYPPFLYSDLGYKDLSFEKTRALATIIEKETRCYEITCGDHNSIRLDVTKEFLENLHLDMLKKEQSDYIIKQSTLKDPWCWSNHERNILIKEPSIYEYTIAV